MDRRRVGLATVLAVAALAGCSTPPTEPLSLSGDIQAHDPVLVAGEGAEPWFVYSTGDPNVADGAIEVRRSDDGRDWAQVGTALEEKPAWVRERVPKVANLWAPELIEHDGTWYLYYAASSFGSNTSAIGLATNSTLDPTDPAYDWVDHGPVIVSGPDDDFNAIDPDVVDDESGTPWLAFGSFWSGIRMVELNWPSGLRADDAEPLRLADRGSPPNAIEAPAIVQHDGDWFLFVSRDSCCKGASSTYKIAVGRADSVTGPYLARDGTPLLDDGVTLLLSSDGRRVGPGGESISGGYLAFHWYDGDSGGVAKLTITPLGWDAEGWPSVSW